MNIYFAFIQSCRKKTYPPVTLINIHHALSKFDGGSDDKDNLIELSYDDHLEAHTLYDLVYPSHNARITYKMMSGQTDDMRREVQRLGAYAAHEACRINQTGFFDPEQQRRNAAASMARPDALKIRSQAGKVGGVRAKENIAIRPDQKFLFSYMGQEVLCFLNCNLGTQVLRDLQQFEFSTTGQVSNMKRGTDLLTGKRKMASNWTCREILKTDKLSA